MKSEIQKYDIEDIVDKIVQMKDQMIKNCDEMTRLFNENHKLSKIIDDYSFDPIRFDYNQYHYKPDDNYIKNIQRHCWRYMIDLFELKKYMLLSEYDRVQKEIEDNNFLEFTRKNVLAWVAGLKDLIYDNLTTLVTQVFGKIIEDYYYTGSGYSGTKKKKRNNNGIDHFFILTTYDYRNVFGYRCDVSITDDLEKCLYILAEKKVPELPIKEIMHKEKISEYENEIWKIKVCKNDNTHYWIKDEKLLQRLNFIGSGKGKIGENIKIKVFDKRWGSKV